MIFAGSIWVKRVLFKVHNAESVKVGLENKLKEKEKEMKEENIRSADQVTITSPTHPLKILQQLTILSYSVI